MKDELGEYKLLKFIREAHNNTYAAPKEVRMKNRIQSPIDGHKAFRYWNREGFEYFDFYSGELWAPGKEIVILDKKPIWQMSYQGQHNENHPREFYQEQVFPFLREALRSSLPSLPFRGPTSFSHGVFHYKFDIEGDYTYFNGRESVSLGGEEVFFQDVMGSIIK